MRNWWPRQTFLCRSWLERLELLLIALEGIDVLDERQVFLRELLVLAGCRAIDSLMQQFSISRIRLDGRQPEIQGVHTDPCVRPRLCPQKIVPHRGRLLPAHRAHAGEDHGHQIDLTKWIEFQWLTAIVNNSRSIRR